MLRTPIKRFAISAAAAKGQVRRVRGEAGFTLVEVCLALGIMAVTLIPLIGVMAMGLGQVRSNIDNNESVNISQQVFLEARQMSFSTLAAKGTYYRYFSAQGDDLGTGTSTSSGLTMANSSQIVYTAVVTVTAYNSSTTPQALPGGDTQQPTLLTLTVQVRKTPGGVYTAVNPVVATYVGMVSCNDLDYSGNSAL
jgi:uncharacterized protein (TIGR02598 family)